MRPFLLATVVALVLGAPRSSSADDGTAVELEVGHTRVLCKEGLAVCPASVLVCEDPKVAVIENGPEGPVLKALSPGSTLCSVSGPGGAFRRLLRVKVVAPPPGNGRGEGPGREG